MLRKQRFVPSCRPVEFSKPGHRKACGQSVSTGRDGYATKRFLTWRQALNLTRDRLAFHSLRKNVGTALERAGVPENEAVQILGHEKLSMSYSVYSLGLDLRGLKKVVEKITYAGMKV